MLLGDVVRLVTWNERSVTFFQKQVARQRQLRNFVSWLEMRYVKF